tara:strand:- start:366 stop:929 length:564 start_codon:yes stop_codon:yes gene_type:complete
MKTFTEYLKEGEKRWKQTSMSPAEAMKEYGKENVKVKKGGLNNGDDMVEIYVESVDLDEATKGCSDCEYMKDETDGEIDTCDECAAEERAKRAKTNEAGGYYTQPVYDMIEEHGYEKVMHELLTALDADVIQDALSRMAKNVDEATIETCEDCGCTMGDPKPGCECSNDGHTHAHEELDYLRKLAGI